MKILHLLTAGNPGGIESLCRDIGKYGKLEHIFCFLTEGGAVYEQMKASGCQAHNLQNLGGKFSIKKLWCLKKMMRDCDALIVHHGDPFLKLYFILLKWITKKYAVTMVHSCYSDPTQLPYKKIKNVLYNYIFQKCFDVADAVWFVSEAGMESALLRYKIDEKKRCVIYNGIAPEFIKDGREHTLPPVSPCRICYVGRLAGIKGVPLLIDAVSRICTDYDVILFIVGSGTEKENLEHQADILGIKENVVFTGQKTDVRPFLKESNIFVYPSICQEVFGISLIEAMAYGIPCIANQVGGIPEIIQDEKNGYLTREPSAGEIERLLRYIIENYKKDVIQKVSGNAKATAERFCITETCERMETEIKKAVKEKSE